MNQYPERIPYNPRKETVKSFKVWFISCLQNTAQGKLFNFDFRKLDKNPVPIKNREGVVVSETISEYDEYRLAFENIRKYDIDGIDPYCRS